MSEPKTPRFKPPTRSAGQLLRYVLWFGVGLVVGLAPFLGNLRIPGFSALLDMYPFTMRSWLLPLSDILMGVLAAYVEFLTLELPSKREIRRRFGRTLAVWAASFVVLLVAYSQVVAQYQDGDRSIAVATGSLTVPRIPPGSQCGCTEGQPAETCLRNIALVRSTIRDCFGPQRVALTELGLAVLYLLLTGSFVLAVGFLVLRQRVADAAAAKSEPAFFVVPPASEPDKTKSEV